MLSFSFADKSMCNTSGWVGFYWDIHTNQLFRADQTSYFITSMARFSFSVTVCIHFFSVLFISPLIEETKMVYMLGAILPSVLIFAIQKRGCCLHMLL